MSHIEQYKILHKAKKNYGASSIMYIDEISSAIDYLKPQIVLDYGCGKGILIDKLQIKYPNIKFYKYDPAIPDWNTLPVNTADLVINTDVLEHIPEDELPSIIKEISQISQNVFFGLHHTKAGQILPNGENAHCTVKPPIWYYNLFSKYFKTPYPLKGKEPELSVMITFSPSSEFIRKYYNIVNQHLQENIVNEKIVYKSTLSNIFSITNEYKDKKKHKVINILGIKIKFKMKNN